MRQTPGKAVLLYLTLCLTISSGCRRLPAKGQFTVDSGYQPVMGTFARVVVVDYTEQQAQQAIEAAFEKIRDIDSAMSDYKPDSLLSKVDQNAFQSSVTVDNELLEVLIASIEYSRISGGAFDITVGPVVQLWRKAKETGIAPTQEQLQKAKESVGYQHLILNPENRTVQFSKQGMFLDLGGIAKGYAVDKAFEILRAAGLKGGMVDIGGNIRCFGTPANGADHWLIGLQDPANDEKILLKLKMDDRAVATSGDYRRFVVVDGTQYSHIIDPATVNTAQSLSSVTIITSTAMHADALSTVVSVLGDKKGMALIESTPDTEAILIPQTSEVTFEKTSGVEQYIESN